MINKRHRSLVLLLSLFALLPIACSESEVDGTSPETETDADADAETDPEADPDADPGTDPETDDSIYPVAESFYAMPQPPAGQRWIVNVQFSDEFNGTEIDSEKWYDYHPDWSGRAPGLFESKNVSVEDGNLVLKAEYMEDGDPSKDDTWYISCAAVISKTQEAHFGYYESRFKANATTMSTTFWLSTHGATNSWDASEQPAAISNGKYSQELDICECIGDDMSDHVGEDGFTLLSGVAAMTDGSSFNAHCFYTPTGGSSSDYNIQRAQSWNTNIETADGSLMSADYHIASCWWRDKASASYYMDYGDNGDEYPVTFSYTSSGSDGMETTPFYLPNPMSINLVVETYTSTWINLPFEEDLADTSKNRTYYDWVRAYVLVDATEPTAENTAEMSMFDSRVQVALADSDSGDLSNVELSMQYTTMIDREIWVVIYNEAGDKLASETFTASAGYANLDGVTITVSDALVADETYYCVAYIGGKGIDLETYYMSGDHFKLVR